ncbi:PLEKHG2 isoform 13, partial [Pan troglodytes]
FQGCSGPRPCLQSTHPAFVLAWKQPGSPGPRRHPTALALSPPRPSDSRNLWAFAGPRGLLMPPSTCEPGHEASLKQGFQPDAIDPQNLSWKSRH